MDYEPLISDKMALFKKEFPDITFCEMIYTLLREMGVKKTSELLSKKDSDFYSSIDKAMNFERE